MFYTHIVKGKGMLFSHSFIRRAFVCATLCFVGVGGASAQSFICENWASYGNSEYFLDYINGNPDEYYRSMYSCPDIEQAIQNSGREGLLGWDGQCGCKCNDETKVFNPGAADIFASGDDSAYDNICTNLSDIITKSKINCAADEFYYYKNSVWSCCKYFDESFGGCINDSMWQNYVQNVLGLSAAFINPQGLPTQCPEPDNINADTGNCLCDGGGWLIGNNEGMCVMDLHIHFHTTTARDSDEYPLDYHMDTTTTVADTAFIPAAEPENPFLGWVDKYGRFVFDSDGQWVYTDLNVTSTGGTEFIRGMENPELDVWPLFSGNSGGESGTSCEPGQYSSDGETCQSCPGGNYCLGGDAQPKECPVGTYSMEGSSVCNVCGDGMTTTGTAKTSPEFCVACDGADNVSNWAQTTWNSEDNTVTNLCSVAGCGENNFYDADLDSCIPCPDGYNYNQNPNKTSVTQCQIKCDAGYYVSEASANCTICPADSYCTGGIYDFDETTPQGITTCPDGLFAPAGMWDLAQCGHIMHIGDSKVYLRSDKATTPSLNIDMDGDGKPDFFGNMTTSDVPMNIDTSQRFKLEYNNQTYSVYDDSIIQ